MATGQSGAAATAGKRGTANACGACSVVVNSDEDEKLKSLWIKCAKCAYWAHARCHNIF